MKLPGSFIVLVVLCLAVLIPCVGAAICELVPGTNYCTVNGPQVYTYNEIPFSIASQPAGNPIEILNSGSPSSLTLNGQTTTKIHFLETAANALTTPNGYNTGQITVFYQDGTSSSVDLIIGVNIAEWAYDRPENQQYLAHNKITPAYSWMTNIDSAFSYDGHAFYISIDTLSKPIDRITISQYGGVVNVIYAITLETANNQPPVADFKSYNLVEEELVEGPHMAGGTIVFIPEGSTDPDGQIVKYDWDFGNGTIITTTDPDEYFKIVYTEPESYTITHTVTDNKGATATATEELDLTLEPGDLILLRSGPPYSTIFNLIGFTYTHVGMYAGKIGGTHYMIESAIKPPIGKSLIKKDGVQLTTFDRWSVNNKEKYADAVKVNVDPETKKRAVAWAMSKLGKKYDFESILLNLKQLDSDVCKAYENKDEQKTCKKLKDAYYCSELIWAAYYSASNGNIDLSIPYFTHVAIPPDALIPDGKYPNPYMTAISWHHEYTP